MRLPITKSILISSIAFLTTTAIFLCNTGTLVDKNERKIKEKYELTKKEDYNRVFDSLHPIVQSLPTRYKDRDSLDLRVYYVEGCRWVGKLNGGSADNGYHSVSNCPKCKAFLLSLHSEH